MSDWIKTAKVGDKVVCTKQGAWKLTFGRDNGGNAPANGDICTIIEISFAPKGEIAGMAILSLEEFGEHWWDARRFRPVEPRKTDISVFTDMLKTVGKPVEEVV